MTKRLRDDPKLQRQFFTEDEKEILPGFGGIGRFRGQTDYTPDEKTVLEYFFDRLDSNVYCAKDTISNDLWGMIMGQYARSDLTCRDRLLKLFRDIKAKDKTGKATSVEDIAAMLRKQEDISKALEIYQVKAGIFIKENGIDYGHASLRDSGTVRMCFEGVSQRATKYIEAAREGAYQEQSTRAMPFKTENLGMPFELRGTKFEPCLMILNKKEMELYNEVLTKLQPFLKEKYQHLRMESDEQIREALGRKDTVLSDKTWEGVIGAKAFDIARYLLPQNITTSLGMTLNTRRFQDMLTEWQSLESLEMQILGKAAQIEALKISPTLMKYGNPSRFYESLQKKRRNLFEELMPEEERKGFEFKHYDLQTKLIAVTPDIEDLVLASILFNGSDSSMSLEQIKENVKSLSFAKRREIAKSQILEKQDYEIHSKDKEIGGFTFERLYDIGAYRDLQRQRGDRQQIAPYTVIGYNMPPEVSELGLEERFVDLMHQIKELHDKIKKEDLHSAAEYIPVMANVIRHVTTKDPVQCFYEGKLRAQPAGAPSYRTIAIVEARIVEEHMPAFKGLLNYDTKDYPLNRLPDAVKKTIKDAQK